MRNVNPFSILSASLKRLCFASSLLAFIPHTYATEDMTLAEDTQWYEVNIAIFKQNTPGFQNEQWRDRDKLNLQFPRRTVMLDDESYDGINFDEIELEPYTPDAPSIPAQQLPTHITSIHVPSSDEQPLTDEEKAFFDNKELPPKITAFRSIDTEDREFKQTLRRLRNSKAYKILTTKTWRQPGLALSASIPVLIQAGEEFDGNYELEGTVNISLSRYLHVQSNLWLSEYVKQIELSNTWWEESTIENAPTFEGLLTDSTYASETDEPGEQNLNDTTTLHSGDSNSSTPLLSALNINESSTHYEAIRTVVIDESRRMRSNELHYLDHPLFGMVIKITSYEAPAPEIEEENLAIKSTELPANKENQTATQKTQPSQQKALTQ